MMDLKVKNGVPEAIEVFGHAFFLNTDFRIWLDFPQRVKDAIKGHTHRYIELFADESDIPVLCDETMEMLNMFFAPEKEIPKSEPSGERTLDYDIDAEYIYGAFMQAYGIDLTECDMHWHKFIALLMCLPEDTLLSKIMSYRGYTGNDKEYSELKYKWALPTIYTEEEQEQIDNFNKFFG